MIECIDEIIYLESNNEMENNIYKLANENFKSKITQVFEKIKSIDTNHNAKVIASGELINNNISLDLECENITLSEKIQFVIDSL